MTVEEWYLTCSIKFGTVYIHRTSHVMGVTVKDISSLMIALVNQKLPTCFPKEQMEEFVYESQ